MKYEKLNPGMEKFHFDNLNKIAYFSRRNRWATPFIVFASIVACVLGKNVSGYKQSLSMLSDDYFSSSWMKFNYICKMMYYRYAYEFECKEFVLYDFYHKNKKEILSYVGGFERARMYGLLNYDEVAVTFRNKYLAYEKFGQYYNRDVLIINNESDFLQYSIFVNSHDKFICKPLQSSSGKGIFVVDKNKDNISMKENFWKLVKNAPYILEEYLTQDDVMSSFHPSSVNTIRFVTYHKDGVTNYLYAMLRVGRYGNVVDNALAGGVTAAVDLKTGEIISDGYCENGDSYEYHPDTNICFKQTRIPKWDELLNVAKSLAESIPEQKIVGWDFALSKDNGWSVIEGNAGPSMLAAQLCHNKGFRPMLADTIMQDIPNGDLYASARL